MDDGTSNNPNTAIQLLDRLIFLPLFSMPLLCRHVLCIRGYGDGARLMTPSEIRLDPQGTAPDPTR